jgi:hypothetical protein
MEVYQVLMKWNIGGGKENIRVKSIPESNPQIMRHEAELQKLKMTPMMPS